MVEAANALRARLRSNEREETDRDYIESCFGRSIYGPQQLALIEQQHCTGNHLGCHLWFTRGTQPVDRPRGAAAEHLAEQAAEQARLNRAGLRQGQRTLSERAAAPDRADPQLHACPPPAGRRPRAAGTARRRACLA